MDLIEKDGQDGLVCKGIPCIDGNCVDKSYMTNGEMMDSVSKLYATSKMQPDKDGNFNLFQGTSQHCSKKATGYSNCCQVESKGWGGNIGAGCNSDEKHLMEQRAKNLCVYVGKQNKGRLNVVVKHNFCCFPTMLDKVIQVEGRKQLGLNFGSGGNANCRGLTLEEIQRLDFSQMDFTEFIEDFKLKFAGRYKSPKPGELGGIASSSQTKLRKYDGNPNNQINNMTGWHGDAKDDSWEAEEEARIERERLAELERQRLAKLEAERLERERLAKLEAERIEKARLAKLEAECRERERLAAAEAQRQAQIRAAAAEAQRQAQLRAQQQAAAADVKARLQRDLATKQQQLARATNDYQASMAHVARLNNDPRLHLPVGLNGLDIRQDLANNIKWAAEHKDRMNSFERGIISITNTLSSYK
jgi:hypothetical protein